MKTIEDAVTNTKDSYHKWLNTKILDDKGAHTRVKHTVKKTVTIAKDCMCDEVVKRYILQGGTLK